MLIQHIKEVVNIHMDQMLMVINLTGEELTPSFNAIEIDWNGADLSSAASSFANAADTAPVSTITTTGELMKGVYSPMFAKAA